MTKIKLDEKISPYPMPVVIVGSVVDGRPNFMTVAWVNRLNGSPNMWGLALGKNQYTLEGIRTNQTFSINIPDKDLVVETDYCGIVSGRTVDKSELFEVFYGELESAPMIRKCPVNLECSVYDIVELPSASLVLGEIKASHTEERFMTDGRLDPKKINPIMFTALDNQYWIMGESVGDAFQIGKQLSK